MASFVEWGETPEEGMILVGFSCEAVLEGKELKSKMTSALREGEVGLRKAVELFKSETLTTFDEALSLGKEMQVDLKKKGPDFIESKIYNFHINRVFWTFEKNIPQNDPRYFKMKILDLNNIDLKKYENEDRSFNAKKFIKEFIDEKDLKKNKGIKKSFSIKEDEPNGSSSQANDNEWEKR